MATLVSYSVGVSKSVYPNPDQDFEDLKEVKIYARKMASLYGREFVSIVGFFEYSF